MRIGAWKLWLVGAIAGLMLASATATAGAATITNGGFETGDFSGWQRFDQPFSAGQWFVYTGTSSPLSHHPVPAPPEGTHAAITDQTFPSGNVLYQDVTLEAGWRHTLSFYVYYASYAPLASPDTLALTTIPNQQYRIDVMKPSAPVTSTSSSDVLATLFQTHPGDPLSLGPTAKTYDLTQFGGQTVRLRFAVTDNENFFNGGVDGVLLRSQAPPAATTQAATAVTTQTATLNASVNPNGNTTTYHFDYGTTTAYGSRTPATDAPAGSDSTAHPLAQAISNLAPGTTYHFRVVATSAIGTTYGQDVTFKTAFTCVVPNLKRKTLGQARRALAAHHCRTGKVTQPPASRRSGIWRVVASSPHAGAVRAAGTRVKLTLMGAAAPRPVPPRFTG